MSLVFTLAHLEALYSLPPLSLTVKDIVGPCEYDPHRKLIILRTKERGEFGPIFSLLHEFRHAMQDHYNTFPQIRELNYDNIESLEDYFALPWERDANEWALAKGAELKLFPVDYIPFWLKGVY